MIESTATPVMMRLIISASQVQRHTAKQESRVIAQMQWNQLSAEKSNQSGGSGSRRTQASPRLMT